MPSLTCKSFLPDFKPKQSSFVRAQNLEYKSLNHLLNNVIAHNSTYQWNRRTQARL